MAGTFKYYITDGTSQATATVHIGISATTVSATNDAISTTEDTPSASTNIVANDSPNTMTIVGISDPPAHGSVSVAGDSKSVTYTPYADYSGTDSFVYWVTDGSSSTSATVTVTVTAVNDPPVANDDYHQMLEETTWDFTLTDLFGNDYDIEDVTVTFQSIQGSSAQSGTIAHVSGVTYRYTPASNFNGADTFTYTVKDLNSPTAGTDTATVHITVVPQNDPPDAINDVTTAFSGVPTSIDVLAGVGSSADTDPDFVSPITSLKIIDIIYDPLTIHGTVEFFTIGGHDGIRYTSLGNVDAVLHLQSHWG